MCDDCVARLEVPSPEACPPGLDACRSVMAYDGRGRDLVVGLKYRNGRGLARLLGAGMAELVDRCEVDLVTWAPTSAERRHARGYDQSRLLARAVARRLGRPHGRTLRRQPGPPQTGRTLAERQDGPRFVAVRPLNARLLVVDDVVTTGATLSAAAIALRGAGARTVTGLTAARTPRSTPPGSTGST